MPNFHWTYVEGEGRTTKVGLFHGKKNGHVMIHCNAKVIIIDFNVRESKTYSFFINQELCEIELERKGDKFYYHFHINEEVDTPLNRARRARERTFWRQALIFISALVLFIVLVLFLVKRFNPNDQFKSQSAPAETGLYMPATVFLDSLEQQFRYVFVINNQIYQGTEEAPDGFYNAFGFPIEDQDEMMVYYLPTNPERNELQLDQPSEKQWKRISDKAIANHLSANPDLSLSQAHCELSMAVALFKASAYSDFYFQSVKPSENEVHNERTYRYLRQDSKYKTRLEENCQN